MPHLSGGRCRSRRGQRSRGRNARRDCRSSQSLQPALVPDHGDPRLRRDHRAPSPHTNLRTEVAILLREDGHRGPITLVGDEKWHPYQRPPLSKSGNLTHPFEAHDVQLRSPSSYERAGVQLRCGDAVVGIDRDRRRVALATGDDLGYAHLVLATGTRPRPLAVPGAGLRGVHYLRTVEDANRLRPLLGESTYTVVIGGGLIGLEIAGSAA